MRVILLSWLQGCISPVLHALSNLGRRVWILLALEADAHVLRIFDSVLAGNTCSLEVTGVNLDSLGKLLLVELILALHGIRL